MNIVVVEEGQSNAIQIGSKMANVKYINKNKKEILNLLNINEDIDVIIFENKKQEMKNRYMHIILHELSSLGYNVAQKGSNYLAEAVFIIYNCRIDDIYNIELEKDIYPIIAQKHNISVHNVKCRIIASTTGMYYSSEDEKLQNYFGYVVDVKPNTKTIIQSVIEKIKI